MTETLPDTRLGVWWIAEDRPDLPAVVASPDGTRTYGELVGAAHQLVHALRATGVAEADTVAVLAPNGVDIVVWSLACQEAGWYFLPLNYHLSAGEVAAITARSGATAIVVDAGFAALGAELADHGGLPARRYSTGGHLPGFVPVGDLTAGAPTTAPPSRRAGAIFSFTSGTTGAPKGIRRPRPDGDPSALAAQASVFGRAFSFDVLSGVHLVAAAMHHVGTHSFYMGALNMGEALAILPRFVPRACLAAIETHRVTTSYMVPTMFHRLLQLPEATRAAYDVSSLRSVVHSAAPCPRPVKERMMAWWGPVIYETYGGSEGAATIAKPHRWLEKPGTVGRSVRGVTVTILDDDGAEVPAGEVGQVYIETGTAPFEYDGDGASTREAFRGRAFTIGDLGYLDDDGYLFICDRAKDMIITGGVNVYPAEVEAVLTGHPAVGDVAVIGVPHDDWGEEVRAVVVPAAGYEPGAALADELVAYVRGELAHYKCPRQVDFRTSLPRTDAGKLYKRRVRDEYWADAGRLV